MIPVAVSAKLVKAYVPLITGIFSLKSFELISYLRTEIIYIKS